LRNFIAFIRFVLAGIVRYSVSIKTIVSIPVNKLFTRQCVEDLTSVLADFSTVRIRGPTGAH